MENKQAHFSPLSNILSFFYFYAAHIGRCSFFFSSTPFYHWSMLSWLKVSSFWFLPRLLFFFLTLYMIILFSSLISVCVCVFDAGNKLNGMDLFTRLRQSCSFTKQYLFIRKVIPTDPHGWVYCGYSSLFHPYWDFLHNPWMLINEIPCASSFFYSPSTSTI